MEFNSLSQRERAEMMDLMAENLRTMKGAATIANGTTSVLVTLSNSGGRTPKDGDVLVTQKSTLGAATEYFISNVSATSFKINVDVDPAEDISFTYRVIV